MQSLYKFWQAHAWVESQCQTALQSSRTRDSIDDALAVGTDSTASNLRLPLRICDVVCSSTRRWYVAGGVFVLDVGVSLACDVFVRGVLLFVCILGGVCCVCACVCVSMLTLCSCWHDDMLICSCLWCAFVYVHVACCHVLVFVLHHVFCCCWCLSLFRAFGHVRRFYFSSVHSFTLSL